MLAHPRFIMSLTLIVLTASLFGGCSFFTPNPSPAAYGVKFAYSQGQRLAFPDFTLEFTGTRRETPPQYPRGFLYYDFAITSGDQKQTVSWTSGTGLIDPQQFQVNGKKFILERVFSDKLGKLNENELVVWEGGLGQ